MVKTQQSGQILLIVVLTMVVALTVGLSIAARIVTELKLSKQNEESQRAFQAAEAGIQQTLLNSDPNFSISIPKDLGNNASFTTTKESDEGASIVLNNGQEVDQAAGGDVWLSNYPDFSSPMGNGAQVAVTVYWGSTNQDDCASGTGNDAAPALEVVLLRGAIGAPTIQRAVFEATSCNRIPGATQGSTPVPIDVPKVGGPRFRYSAPLLFNGSSLSDGLILKVIPIFNSTIVGFRANGGPVFPPQGSIVTSTGTSGDTVRKVTYYQSFPQLPLEVFPYSLLSQ